MLPSGQSLRGIVADPDADLGELPPCQAALRSTAGRSPSRNLHENAPVLHGGVTARGQDL
jgi:hypothetical protein